MNKKENHMNRQIIFYLNTRKTTVFFSFLDKITECTHSISISIGMHKYYEYLRILANK